MELSVRVLGLGNVLMGDDALGPWVIEYLQATCEFPEGVSVLDVGTPGLDLVPYLSGATNVVIVDTVKSDGAPGELRLYRKAEILRVAPQPRLSPHDPGVKETLMALDFEGDGPSDVLLVGVIPGSVEMGVGLTKGVQDAVEKAAQEVLKELERLGLAATPRVPALAVSPWWEEPASPVVH